MKIIVAVDFGTTFSGIAYANTKEPDVQRVLTQWGPGTPSNGKVPSILYYDNGGMTGPFHWGFKARAEQQRGKKVHEWFKLGLCPEYEERRAAESELNRKYPSTTALDPVKGEEAEKLVVDYLASLKKRVDEHFRELDRSVNEIPREYIITVPAIWDHKEQERTRSCAERAGMGQGSKLQIVSEPEAAAIYALSREHKIGLKVDDTFIICDAGGGTVDLTSYTIRHFNPISLDGAGKGSGGLCGSSFLNRIFANYLERKMENYHGNWDQGCLKHAVNEFERSIKIQFTADDNETYSIMMPALSDSPSHGITGGSLNFSGKELKKHVFDKVITKVQDLVKNQIDNTPGRVKAVLLAGGFGQNSYLKNRLERVESVKSQSIPVRCIENSETAVVRGALMAGLTRHGREHGGKIKVQVISRIAGKSYGTKALQPFRQGEDPVSRRESYNGEDLVERMQWFVKEGERIQDSTPKSFSYQKEQEIDLGSIKGVDIYIYSCEKRDTDNGTGPKYPDDKGVRECAHFRMDLQGLHVPITEHQGIRLYVAKFDIEMTLESASLSFCGVYKNTDWWGVYSEKRFQPEFVQFT